MIKAFRYIWAVYFLLLFIVFFILFYPFFLITLSRRKWYPIAHKLRALWGYIIMYLSGLWPSTTFEQPLAKKKTYIFIANHFSYLDILSLNVQLGSYFRFMAKKELAQIPLFGIFFRTIDISVDRKNVRESVKAFNYANAALRAGDSLGIFPEGRIGNSVPDMTPFKQGAFKMAVENQIPIVPVVIIDNWKRLPDGGLENGGTPGRMRMVVLKPIETMNHTAADIPMLMKESRSLIQETFNKHNHRNSK
ncbi:MAG: 1-acyl-sn-glycerol-3-phosphate acyltransferase [Bacteroidia bacterium]|jgi:1-acyl-sn-glycerol-3-phosphate acyltransferase